MKNEKLIPSLIEEDKTSLPKRGGKYVSDEEREKKEHERTERHLMQKLRECNCNCNCHCDSCDDHPFFKGEGSCS